MEKRLIVFFLISLVIITIILNYNYFITGSMVSTVNINSDAKLDASLENDVLNVKIYTGGNGVFNRLYFYSKDADKASAKSFEFKNDICDKYCLPRRNIELKYDIKESGEYCSFIIERSTNKRIEKCFSK